MATTLSVELAGTRTSHEHWVRFSLTGHEPMTARYGSRQYRPDSLTIKYDWYDDGTAYVSVQLAGPALKKDGSDSKNRVRGQYYSKWSSDWDALPGWILDLVKEHAPDGVRQA